MAANKNDEAWQTLFEELDILSKIDAEGKFKISSKDINKYRESRLMTKFDHTNNLPKLFSDNDLSILPISRGDYLIGNFDAYSALKYDTTIKPIEISFPASIESIDFNNIYSEASALNCAYVSGIMNEVMGEECLPTLSGRMSTKKFDFKIKNIINSDVYDISVADSQCEIDGGYESDNALMIVEAKNSLINDFLIRQLYYPYRLWNSKVKKQVKTVFFTYSNNVYNFFLYDFERPDDYNSLVLLEQKNFAIAPEKITIEEIKAISDSITIIPEPEVPFPQADSFKKVIDLISLLVVNDMTTEDVRTNYDFDVRQSFYYTSAVHYLGLAEKYREDGSVYYGLNNEGKDIMSLPYKRKYLEIVKRILRHEVFNKSLQAYFSKAAPITKDEALDIMKSCDIYKIDKESSTLGRRSQTVVKWIDWILDLTT